MSQSLEENYGPCCSGVFDLCGYFDREWHALDVYRVNCGHAGYITAPKLRRFYPRHMKIADMAHRFKCTNCNSRGCVDWTLVKQKR